uniref:Uncharacterized protein n=1 Tax=Utricularia reniformis TaxID=192314 RepID=A0A1Y0B3B5_9LAMI|nr:hypothetical protein AEK19_MT1691 [Utricularia reniformis]ART31873.1 hypothetical protein AEK19_MT1691 [Utricularia reniformis]
MRVLRLFTHIRTLETPTREIDVEDRVGARRLYYHVGKTRTYIRRQARR